MYLAVMSLRMAKKNKNIMYTLQSNTFNFLTSSSLCFYNKSDKFVNLLKTTIGK